MSSKDMLIVISSDMKNHNLCASTLFGLLFHSHYLRSLAPRRRGQRSKVVIKRWHWNNTIVKMTIFEDTKNFHSAGEENTIPEVVLSELCPPQKRKAWRF